MTSSKKIEAFRREVWEYYKKHGRKELPWRRTTDPYKILVSEVMLQQTQVSRVIEKYKSFIKKFPTVRALAKASLSEVLKEWNGLGYNRRAKYFHDASKIIFGSNDANVKEALRHPLPGVGPYTRAAVRTFAFNEPHVFIETNIRTAFIHHFFASTKPKYKGEPFVKLADADLIPIATLAAKGQDPRKWHWALMDYGASLKRSGVRNNSRSKQYVRQSKFEGSLRQVRGEILRQLHVGKQPKGDGRLAAALKGLEHDGLIKQEERSARGGSASGRKWRIA